MLNSLIEYFIMSSFNVPQEVLERYTGLKEVSLLPISNSEIFLSYDRKIYEFKVEYKGDFVLSEATLLITENKNIHKINALELEEIFLNVRRYLCTTKNPYLTSAEAGYLISRKLKNSYFDNAMISKEFILRSYLPTSLKNFLDKKIKVTKAIDLEDKDQFCLSVKYHKDFKYSLKASMKPFTSFMFFYWEAANSESV